MATDAERLSALKTAIDTFIANGAVHSYTADGVTVTRESLAAQMKYRDYLEQKVAVTKIRGRRYADLRGYAQ